jgi:hypothetical protein
MHFSKPNYECPKCEVIFLPYKIGIKCPNCSKVISDIDSEDYLDTVENITESMSAHKHGYGKYFPGAWMTSDILDHVQSLNFRIFDALEREKPENEEEFLMGILDKSNWGEQLYLKEHVKEITKEVLVVYRAKEFSKIVDNRPKTKINPGDICIKADVQKNKLNKSIFQKLHDWFEYRLMK